MSTIDEKFSKLIAEKTAVEEEVVEEEAATGDAAIKKGAVPPQKSDLKNDGTEVASNSKEKPEGTENVGAKAAAPVTATKDSTLKTKPSGASSAMPGGLSAKIFDEVEAEGEVVSEEEITEDIAAILSGADLSEEFQEKAKTVFEAAVTAKVSEQVAAIKESTEAKLVEEIESLKEEFAGRVENFLNYACEEWMSENELAIEQGLRAEIAEGFLAGLRGLFIESNINVPTEQLDVVAEMSEKLDEMETRLNEQVEKNIQLHERVSSYRRNEILSELTRGLAETQKDKFTSLAEAVEFKTEESYREKLIQIKESYFGTPKVEVAEEISSEPAKIETVSESMSAYVAALAKRI
jgi:hypothetical protein